MSAVCTKDTVVYQKSHEQPHPPANLRWVGLVVVTEGQLLATEHPKKLDEMEQGHNVKWPLASVCLCVDVVWFVHRMECPVWQCESVTLLS